MARGVSTDGDDLVGSGTGAVIRRQPVPAKKLSRAGLSTYRLRFVTSADSVGRGGCSVAVVDFTDGQTDGVSRKQTRTAGPRAYPRRPWCSGQALVSVVQAANLWDRDAALARSVDRTRDRSVFGQRQMGARSLVIVTVQCEESFQARFVEH